MEVEYNFFGPVRDAVGEKTVTREVADGTTVEEALCDVSEEFPALAEHLFDSGDLTDVVNVTVNRTNVQQINGPRTALEEGDVLRVSPPIVGG